MSIEAMKQALDALEGWAGHGKWIYPESALEQAMKNTSEAIPVLRAAIQQAEEPHWKLSCGCPSEYGGIPAEWATTDRDGSPAIAYGVICEKHWHEYDAQHPKVWQEPVAWMTRFDDPVRGSYGKPADLHLKRDEADRQVHRHIERRLCKLRVEPIYGAPQPTAQRAWRGLTDEEIEEGWYASWVEKQAFETACWWANSKLKEKNTCK